MMKKITMNKLDDNQLENVVGGCSYESFELFHALRDNSAFQKDYPSLFAPPVNQEVTIDDDAMAKALLEKWESKRRSSGGLTPGLIAISTPLQTPARYCIIGMSSMP